MVIVLVLLAVVVLLDDVSTAVALGHGAVETTPLVRMLLPYGFLVVFAVQYVVYAGAMLLFMRLYRVIRADRITAVVFIAVRLYPFIHNMMVLAGM